MTAKTYPAIALGPNWSVIYDAGASGDFFGTLQAIAGHGAFFIGTDAPSPLSGIRVQDGGSQVQAF